MNFGSRFVEFSMANVERPFRNRWLERTLLNMRLAYTGTWRPNVTWESDDGQWRFHVWFDPVTLEPEKTFHKNPVDRSQVEVPRTKSSAYQTLEPRTAASGDCNDW